MSREILIRNAIRCLSVLFIVISNTLQSYADTWGDYGTYSISWYNKSQTEFTISTPEELAGVAYLVNNNFTSFSGKKIYIDADINLYGRSWTPIGINTTIFEGEIVGNNHSIYNLKIENEFDNKSGFFIDLRNAQLRDVRFQGSVSSKVAFTVGLVAASATSTEFINLRVDNSIQVRKYEVGFASNSSYTLEIGGVIGKSSKCKYSNIKSLSSLDFQWGTLDGNNCYGKMSLSCGGLVGESNKDSFEKCQSSNDCKSIINGFETNINYNPDASFVTYGGIAGICYGDGSSIISCFAENKNFTGQHPNGTHGTVNFRFGGIVAYMSTYATLKNCVAINRTYDIEGHYSWQSGRDLTYSYFGGIACEVPKHYYGGCFSNKDVNITTSHLKGNYSMENGSTSNTASQMNSAAFVDELNLYSQIEFDKDNWMLDENEKLSIKFDFNENTGEYDITAGFDETAPCEYFSLSGVKMGNVKESLAPGVYIVRQGGKAKKITVK